MSLGLKEPRRGFWGDWWCAEGVFVARQTLYGLRGEMKGKRRRAGQDFQETLGQKLGWTWGHGG